MSESRTLPRGPATASALVGRVCTFGIGAMLLASCSSPPKPPSVDESTRRPVNATAAIDLRSCQGDLSRATILVSELARNGTTTGEPSKTVGPPGGDKANADGPATVATAEAGNLVAVVAFGLGSASWSVDQADAAALVRRANGAAVIMIRGRTDATGDSPQETALARRRAEAAADFLQLAGVPKDKLRLTWQGAGDPVAGPHAGERAQSRRVEIEFYTAAPMLVSVRTGGLNPHDAQGGQGKASAQAPSRARFDAASL